MNKKLLTFIFGIIFLVGLISLVNSFDWTTRVTSYWKLDNNNLNDTLGVNNGTNTGTVNVSGIILDGRDFESTETDSINIGSNTIDITTENISVNAWIKLESNSSTLGTSQFIIGSKTVNAWAFYVTPSGDFLTLGKYGVDEAPYGTTAINKGAWHMVTMTYDQNANILRYYVNGTADGSNPVSYSTTFLGGITYYLGQDFDGIMDEVGVKIGGSVWTQSEITELYNSGLALAYGDTGGYTTNVTLTSPANNSLLSTESNNFSSNFSIGGINPSSFTWRNATYSIWFSNGTLFNQTTVDLTNVNETNNTILFNNFNIGNYLWDVGGCYANATFTNCTVDSNGNFSFTIGSNISSVGYNTLSYETASEIYYANISTFNSLIPTSGKLDWNGTNYTATISSLGGNNYNISYSRITPTISNAHNITFKFYWNIDSITEISSTYNQTLNLTVLALCNATYTTPYINFTFKDEGNSSNTTANIPTSTFIYWLGDGTINKTLTYSNTSENSNYTFCFSPVDKNVSIDIRMQYEGADYPQRIYNPTVMNFSNSTFQKILYLLSTNDGQYVTFQVVNLAEQTISNVEMNATREISGSDVVVGQGTTGDDGTVTLWLNPNFIHTYVFSKVGVDTLITSFAPTQTSYTITMNTGTTVNDNDYVKGISIQIKPTQTALQNGTIYNFNMTLNSSYWDVSLFGFTLEDVDGNVLNSSSSTAGSGTVSATWNTSNYSKVYMKYYYVINSTYTNYSRAWTIYDTETGIGFGLSTFFTDLRNYFTTGDGLFGSTEFALAIITFLAIFLITGVFAYSFGISSPATISGLIFGLVLFFDVGVGLLPNVNDNHAITLIMAIITVALFAREVSR